MRWNGVTGEVSVYEADAKDWKILFSYQPQRDDTYIDEWKNFIECVTQKTHPFVSGDDGIKVLQIIDAVRKSALMGKQISVLAIPQVEDVL